MRTLLFLVGGVALWLAIAYFAKFAGARPAKRWVPVAIFGLVWLCIAGWNMWVGITLAGYSFWEELPIFLLIFVVPLGVAVFTSVKLRQSQLQAKPINLNDE